MMLRAATLTFLQWETLGNLEMNSYFTFES